MHNRAVISGVDKNFCAARIRQSSFSEKTSASVNQQLNRVLLKSDIPGLELRGRGKVRDIYGVDGDRLLIIASDRISAFDFVLASGIPDKGRVLTQISLFWFDFLKEIVPNHLVTADLRQYPVALQRHADQLEGRSMLVVKADMVPIECVARGYLSGSGWKDYQKTGKVCGIQLPPGLRESDKLPRPIFTPAVKASTGHDENISFDRMVELAGGPVSEQLRELTMRLYTRAADYAAQRGIIIADTKFEFGRTAAGMTLADEVLTPDSSRFWPADKYQPGRAQESFDKQYVRDYLESIHWNKQAPAPGLPENVQQRTSEKYREAYRRLTGRELETRTGQKAS